ncbi:hypothetical protein V2J09_023961 [Rumex salicifolius]
MAFLRGKMVHCQRYYHHLKKGEVVISGFVEVYNGSTRANTLYSNKRGKPRLFFLLFLCLLSFALICFSPPGSLGAENEKMGSCSSVSNGTICCDRSSHRTDVCIMKGDVRTDSSSSSIFLYTPKTFQIPSYPGKQEKSIDFQAQGQQIEKIRPYTRKWEASVMNTIEELKLVSSTNKDSRVDRKCDVYHDVPAVFFSTGGYTGNVYHEFNDGILPLYITSQQFKKKVVFVILEYHDWWYTKYANILSHLSDYAPIDFNNDKRTHCFQEAIVGLRIHDELAVDSALMPGNESIKDFRELLDRAYWPRIKGLMEEEKRNEQQIILQQRMSQSPTYSYVKPKLALLGVSRKPKLAILSRNVSRSITNEALLVQMAERIGFDVQVIRPGRTSELAKIYRVLNSSDVMIGVHGAAMTHFLFMKPSCVIPLGTEWAAATYYGEPAMKLGLKYIGYQILPRESSLYNDYDRNDPVLKDPKSVADKGWEFTKKIYLDNQNIEIDLKRFKKRLVRAYNYISRPWIEPPLSAHSGIESGMLRHGVENETEETSAIEVFNSTSMNSIDGSIFGLIIGPSKLNLRARVEALTAPCCAVDKGISWHCACKRGGTDRSEQGCYQKFFFLPLQQIPRFKPSFSQANMYNLLEEKKRSTMQHNQSTDLKNKRTQYNYQVIVTLAFVVVGRSLRTGGD